MASSSVSQESLDITEDYEITARRSRIRTLRAKGAFHKPGDHEPDSFGDRDGWDVNGGDGSTLQPGTSAGEGIIHDSPSRSAAQRMKDKRRPSHLQKGKPLKDKRKLREKRRSTGVVHLASTESTGDSLDDDHEEEKVLTEAKRNTTYNEVIDDDNPQTPSEVMRRIQQFQTLTLTSNNKPSQEIVSSTKPLAPKGYVARRNKSPSDLEADLEDNQDYDSAVSQSDTSFAFNDQSSKEASTNQNKPRVWSSQSKFNSYSTNSKPSVTQSDQHSSSSQSPLSQQSSGFTRKSAYDNDRSPVFQPSQPKSPRSPRSPKSAGQTSVGREPVRAVPSVMHRYPAERERQDAGAGYRSKIEGVRGPFGQHFVSSLINKENKDDDVARRRLEKDLERERDENRRLQNVLEEKDRRIAELERKVAMLNRDVEECLEDNEKLEIENRALIQAVGQLSTRGSHV
ncbi:PRKC apoptosis WT1 regulator protein-like isoform X2 [Mya arenaria]|uniref:PRKC apoptosis WT1 regulator protein-like isoform X2 n=1 Tax=Mya arenaria TaxID=6604 RepID=UPI0022DF7D37|nr:PRKC apoptosis WT1 regulator protein-like isoform X2 [Mya arenaria]XP_052810461.1 PRKC apoptosis WT1 regulator protein-like isoform X2 [Mya arenaria]